MRWRGILPYWSRLHKRDPAATVEFGDTERDSDWSESDRMARECEQKVMAMPISKIISWLGERRSGAFARVLVIRAWCFVFEV